MNLNDPLLQFIMQQLAQAEAGGAPPVQGITPALQQGAIPVSSGPMTTVGFPNQPLSVSPERAATLSPLEQQLSQAANNRAFAEPSPDQLAFEKSTLGFLQGINDQNTGVYDRRMQAQALAAKEAADRQAEIDKVQAPKLIDQEIERMKIEANKTKDETERKAGLDKLYLESLAKISASASMDKDKELALLGQEYRKLRAPKSAPAVDPVKALTGEVDKLLAGGMKPDEIKQQLILEAEQNPQFADAARAAIDYLDKKPAATAKPTPAPMATPKQASPMNYGSPDQVYMEQNPSASKRFEPPSTGAAANVYAQARRIDQERGRQAAEQALLRLLPLLDQQDLRGMSYGQDWIGNYVKRYLALEV